MSDSTEAAPGADPFEAMVDLVAEANSDAHDLGVALDELRSAVATALAGPKRVDMDALGRAYDRSTHRILELERKPVGARSTASTEADQ